MLQRCSDNVQHQLPDKIQRVKWIMHNIDSEESDVQGALYSIRMDGKTTGLRNDSEAAVAFILPTDLVPKKRKEKRSVSGISPAKAYENKIGGVNFPRK